MSLEDGVKISAKLCAKIYAWEENTSGEFPKLCSLAIIGFWFWNPLFRNWSETEYAQTNGKRVQIIEGQSKISQRGMEQICRFSWR